MCSLPPPTTLLKYFLSYIIVNIQDAVVLDVTEDNVGDAEGHDTAENQKTDKVNQETKSSFGISMSSASALLVMCCFGGQPIVDLHLDVNSTQVYDPTDWVAVDVAGSLLENSSLSVVDRIVQGGTPLADCDLFNLTFTSLEDNSLFEHYRGALGCRCPPFYSGESCEIPPPIALASVAQPLTRELTPPMLLIVGAVLLALFFVTFMVMRGCFCDCFGPFRTSTKHDDEPLDPEVVSRLLNKARAVEARRDREAHERQYGPLVSTVCEDVHSIPTSASPYSGVVPPPPPPPEMRRPASPPPSYSSVAGSLERIAEPQPRTTQTRV